METAQKNNTALSIKEYFAGSGVQKKFKELIGEKAQGFVTSVLQVVASNSLLAKADPPSVYGAAAAAAVLDLPINNSLGFAYIVPYNERQADGSKKCVAQFQVGYKGFIQLAQRSGLFKSISAAAIYDGQVIAENPLTGYEFDFTVKGTKVVGYAAYFQLLNGFEKTLYMTVDELEKHGSRYSQTYKSGRGIWKDNFEAMAIKTVIKLLLSKYGPMSIAMQKAINADQSRVNDIETDDVTHVDASDVEVIPEHDDLQMLYDFKKESLLSEDREHAERILNNQEVNSYPKLHKMLSEK